MAISSAREALIEAVAALKHDLGKYSSWRCVNLEESAWSGPVEAPLVESLQADLLRTRMSSSGAPEAAWEVWARLSAGLELPLPAPELEDVAAAVATLRAAEAPLRAGDRAALAELRAGLRAAQATIRAALLQLHRRLLRSAGA